MSTPAQSSAPRVPTPLRLAGLAWDVAAQRISDWATGVTQLLSGDLRLGVHAACQIVSGSMTTDGTGVGTVVLKTRFTSKPAGAVVLQITQRSGVAAGTHLQGWEWKDGSVSMTLKVTETNATVTVTALVVLG